MDASVMVSVLSLMISVIALLGSFRTSRRQEAAEFDRARGQLRLEVHDAMRRVVALLRSTESDDSPDAVHTRKLLVETGDGLAEMYNSIRRIDPAHPDAVRLAERSYRNLHVDVEEMARVIGLAETATAERNWREVSAIARGLWNRVYAEPRHTQLSPANQEQASPPDLARSVPIASPRDVGPAIDSNTTRSY